MFAIITTCYIFALQSTSTDILKNTETRQNLEHLKGIQLPHIPNKRKLTEDGLHDIVGEPSKVDVSVWPRDWDKDTLEFPVRGAEDIIHLNMKFSNVDLGDATVTIYDPTRTQKLTYSATHVNSKRNLLTSMIVGNEAIVQVRLGPSKRVPSLTLDRVTQGWTFFGSEHVPDPKQQKRKLAEDLDGNFISDIVPWAQAASPGVDAIDEIIQWPYEPMRSEGASKFSRNCMQNANCAVGTYPNVPFAINTTVFLVIQGQGEYYCTGTLIANDDSSEVFIMTATHCIGSDVETTVYVRHNVPCEAWNIPNHTGVGVTPGDNPHDWIHYARNHVMIGEAQRVWWDSATDVTIMQLQNKPSVYGVPSIQQAGWNGMYVPNLSDFAIQKMQAGETYFDFDKTNPSHISPDGPAFALFHSAGFPTTIQHSPAGIMGVTNDYSKYIVSPHRTDQLRGASGGGLWVSQGGSSPLCVGPLNSAGGYEGAYMADFCNSTGTSTYFARNLFGSLSSAFNKPASPDVEGQTSTISDILGGSEFANQVVGCTDASFCSYDARVTVHDDDYCFHKDLCGVCGGQNTCGEVKFDNCNQIHDYFENGNHNCNCDIEEDPASYDSLCDTLSRMYQHNQCCPEDGEMPNAFAAIPAPYVYIDSEDTFSFGSIPKYAPPTPPPNSLFATELNKYVNFFTNVPTVHDQCRNKYGLVVLRAGCQDTYCAVQLYNPSDKYIQETDFTQNDWDIAWLAPYSVDPETKEVTYHTDYTVITEASFLTPEESFNRYQKCIEKWALVSGSTDDKWISIHHSCIPPGSKKTFAISIPGLQTFKHGIGFTFSEDARLPEYLQCPYKLTQTITETHLHSSAYIPHTSIYSTQAWDAPPPAPPVPPLTPPPPPLTPPSGDSVTTTYFAANDHCEGVATVVDRTECTVIDRDNQFCTIHVKQRGTESGPNPNNVIGWGQYIMSFIDVATGERLHSSRWSITDFGSVDNGDCCVQHSHPENSGTGVTYNGTTGLGLSPKTGETCLDCVIPWNWAAWVEGNDKYPDYTWPYVWTVASWWWAWSPGMESHMTFKLPLNELGQGFKLQMGYGQKGWCVNDPEKGNLADPIIKDYLELNAMQDIKAFSPTMPPSPSTPPPQATKTPSSEGPKHVSLAPGAAGWITPSGTKAWSYSTSCSTPSANTGPYDCPVGGEMMYVEATGMAAHDVFQLRYEGCENGVDELIFDYNFFSDQLESGSNLEVLNEFGKVLWRVGPRNEPYSAYLFQKNIALNGTESVGPTVWGPPPITAQVQGLGMWFTFQFEMGRGYALYQNDAAVANVRVTCYEAYKSPPSSPLPPTPPNVPSPPPRSPGPPPPPRQPPQVEPARIIAVDGDRLIFNGNPTIYPNENQEMLHKLSMPEITVQEGFTFNATYTLRHIRVPQNYYSGWLIGQLLWGNGEGLGFEAPIGTIEFRVRMDGSAYYLEIANDFNIIGNNCTENDDPFNPENERQNVHTYEDICLQAKFFEYSSDGTRRLLVQYTDENGYRWSSYDRIRCATSTGDPLQDDPRCHYPFDVTGSVSYTLPAPPVPSPPPVPSMPPYPPSPPMPSNPSPATPPGFCPITPGSFTGEYAVSYENAGPGIFGSEVLSAETVTLYEDANLPFTRYIYPIKPYGDLGDFPSFALYFDITCNGIEMREVSVGVGCGGICVWDVEQGNYYNHSATNDDTYFELWFIDNFESSCGCGQPSNFIEISFTKINDASPTNAVANMLANAVVSTPQSKSTKNPQHSLQGVALQQLGDASNHKNLSIP